MLRQSNVYTLTTAHIGDGLHPINRPINCCYSLLSKVKNELPSTNSNILCTSTSFRPRRSGESINSLAICMVSSMQPSMLKFV